MKKIILLIALMLAGAVSMNAGTPNKDANGRTVYGPYATGKLLDNWFIGAGIGTNFGHERFAAPEAQTVKMKGWGGNIDVYAGKWITPNFGIKLGYQIGNSSVNSKWAWAWPSNDRAVSLHYLHGDVMWSLTNQIGGWREDRLIDVNPYLHAGVIWREKTADLGTGVGVEVLVRISKAFSIVPDFRWLISYASGNSPAVPVYGSMLTNDVSVNVSLRWNIRGKNFARVSEYENEAKAVAEGLYRDALKTLEKTGKRNENLAEANALLFQQNEVLKKRCENLEKSLEETVNAFPTEYDVYFGIGSAVIDAGERIRLKEYVDAVKGNKIIVTAGADASTGTKSYNKALSERRAKAVIEYLKKLGADPEKMSWEAVGGVSYGPSAEYDRCSVVVIK